MSNPDTIRVISSGVPAIDRLTGVGGYPRGALVEMFGPRYSGKTTLALKAIAEVQRRGGRAFYGSLDYPLDVAYAERLGVDVGALAPSVGDPLEQVEDLLRHRLPGLQGRPSADLFVVVDAMGARFGSELRALTNAVRTLTGLLQPSDSTLLLVNEVLPPKNPGRALLMNNESVGNSNALKFYTTLRLQIRRREGGVTVVRSVKNKLSRPFEEAELELTLARPGDLPLLRARVEEHDPRMVPVFDRVTDQVVTLMERVREGGGA